MCSDESYFNVTVGERSFFWDEARFWEDYSPFKKSQTQLQNCVISHAVRALRKLWLRPAPIGRRGLCHTRFPAPLPSFAFWNNPKPSLSGTPQATASLAFPAHNPPATASLAFRHNPKPLPSLAFRHTQATPSLAFRHTSKPRFPENSKPSLSAPASNVCSKLVTPLKRALFIFGVTSDGRVCRKEVGARSSDSRSKRRYKELYVASAVHVQLSMAILVKVKCEVMRKCNAREGTVLLDEEV